MKNSSVYQKNWYKSKPGYHAWQNAKDRVTNPNNPRYKDYGGRGITMCKRWINSYADFLADMGVKPKGLTLDRINVNGNYTPQNCRWATWGQQARNQRTYKNNTSGYKGVYKNGKGWQAMIGVHGKLLHVGWFREFDNAITARKLAERKYFN